MIATVAAVLVLGGYLLGSIPTGLWLGSALAGIDIRRGGSHRTGATNVQRQLGTRAAVAVLAIDFAKGALAVLAVRAFTGNEYIAALAGLAAVIGHVWPVFAGFRGGRGVATGGGAIIALAPLALALTLATLAVVVALTRYVSLGSVVEGFRSRSGWCLLRGRTPGGRRGAAPVGGGGGRDRAAARRQHPAAAPWHREPPGEEGRWPRA